MKKQMTPLRQRVFSVRVAWRIALVLLGGSTVQAQTVSGNYAIRFPTELPFLYGNPDLISVPIMAGGNAGGVSATNNLGSTNLLLRSSIFGQNVEHLAPNAYLGQALNPPVFTSGATVVWSAMTNTALISPAGNAFFEPSARTMYAAVGGEVMIKWQLSDGSEVDTTYVVESAPAGRPYRVYWTDRGAPKVQLGGVFVKFHYNNQITAPQYGFTTNNGVVTSNVVAGLYIDSAGSLNAVGGQQGMIVMQYFKNGMYNQQVSTGSVIVIEVLPPDNQTLTAYLGERILPQGGWEAANELVPEITAGLSGDDVYLFQHVSSDGSQIPKEDWVFPIRYSVDDPWNIEIYWKVSDLMGIEWFYEVDDYAADWPLCINYVRGDGADAGAALYFPSNMTPSIMAYQEPDGGCATMQNSTTLITTTNTGRCLVQLISQDENVWFLPLQLITRNDPSFDLLPRDWMISREIAPFATARSAWFPETGSGKIVTSDMILPGDFTLEGWFKPDNLEAQTNASMILFDKRVDGAPAYSNQVNLILYTGASNSSCAAGTLQASIGSGTNSVAGPSFLATNLLKSFEWTHVALARQGKQLTLYVNGIKAGSTQWGNTILHMTNASPLSIGKMNSGVSSSFRGFIDNLRVWTNALSAAQVNTAMSGNYNGMDVPTLVSQGLDAYFPINEYDTLGNLADLTGHHTSTITNCLLPDVGAVGMSDTAAYSQWYGYLYESFGNSYNTNFYRAASSADPDAGTAIFGVNTNSNLEVWWSQKIQLPEMPSPVYVPNWVQRYCNTWPDLQDSPQIVLASGQGSRQGGIYEQGFCLALTNSGTPGSVIIRKGTYFSGDFTIGAWIDLNVLALSDGSPIFSVCNTSADGSSTEDLVLFAIRSDGVLLLHTQNGTASSVVTGPMTTTGRWVYVMATLSGGNATLYVNNNPVGSSTGMQIPQSVIRTNCFIGYDTVSNVFDGRIDEVRIWSSALSADQRQAAMYNIISELDVLDVTTYFPFDPYKGSLILDLATGNKALVFNGQLAAPGAPASGSRLYSPDEHAGIYVQNNTNQPGFNPNEEHAIVNRENGSDVVYAFRDDLNAAFHQSEPFVLVNYLDPITGLPAMDALHVVRTSTVYQVFEDSTLAGSPLDGPHPLDLLPSHWTGKDLCDSGPAWRAKDNTWFALAAGSSPTATSTVIMRNYYPMQPTFWFPGVASNRQPAAGTAIPWLPTLTTQQYQKTGYPTNGLPIPVDWTISWPSAIPTLDVGDTLLTARDGLPQIWGQLSVDIVYQESTYDETNKTNNSVFLYDPVCPRGVTITNALEEYGFTQGGAAPTIYMRNGWYYFYNLPPDLSDRFYFNPTLSQSNLVLIGEYEAPLTGNDYVLVNELNSRQRAILMNLVDTNNAYQSDWARAIGLLATENVEIKPNQPYDGVALHAPGDGAGYVTLAFNNATNPAMGISSGTPISLALIQVVTNLATGTAIPMEDSYNLLSQQMSMLFSLDFAGEPGNYEFEWRWTEPNANGTTPTDPLLCDVYTNGVGINSLILDGTSPDDMLNRFFAVRYRARSNTVVQVVGTNWSDFTAFSLAEGWVQRILNAITPFEQRMRDLYNNPVETQVSMISQAGAPYEGNVALNQDNIDNVGLIQLYITVLDVAQTVMDNAGLNDADANQQLLLAASRLNDLYMLLGNEAYADAMDPTIGFGSTMTVNNNSVLPMDYGSLASSLFCFDNQTANLLDEELALLRGRSNPSLAPGMDVSPVYNRLYWNYTKGITAGEVAYSVNYDITGHTNVIIDATAAAERFPQGHGDAWGYYLDALSVYYTLLNHPTFDWGIPSISPLLMNDLTIDADYFDEKKFAEAAAALARTGVEVTEHSYRQSYDEAQNGLFPGYADSNTNRAWGVGQWASRAGVGALCNWMVGNSLLPAPSGWLTNAASLALAGAGYALLPGSPYFNGDFTLEVWVNLRSYSASSPMNILSFANGDGSELVALQLQATNRSPALCVVTGGVSSTTRASTAIATGQWTHIAVTLAGDQASLYINGALAQQASGQTAPSYIIRTNNFAGLGVLPGEVSFAGSLCEIRVWSGARAAADIAADMNRRLNGGEAGLVAYWPANEGGGSALLDRSYNGLIAQTEGVTAWTNNMPTLSVNTDYDDPGILTIDRSTVAALPEIATSLRSIQSAVDNADRGLNPLGLARSSIPFDIDPRDIDNGGSHFEQILARAETALNNADSVFDAVQDAGRLLRQQQQNANNFQAAANSQEADYTRQLIELYGYPYSDDIGAGQTYPAGYDGPDLYHYMYVDMSALGWSGTDVEPIAARTYVFDGDGVNSILTAYGFATNLPAGELTSNVTNSISFYYASMGLPCKPTTWSGTRQAEGRLQMAYAEFLKQLLSYRQALQAYEDKTDYLNETFEWYTQTWAPYKDLDFSDSQALLYLQEAQNTYEALLKFRKLLLEWRKQNESTKSYFELTTVPMSQLIGTSTGGDLFSLIRGSILSASAAQQEILSLSDVNLEALSIAGSWTVDSTEFGTELTELIHDHALEAIDQETDLNELAREQGRVLDAAQVAFQGLIQSYQNMIAVEQEGQRLLAARQRDRSETANRIASMRYSDMAFRIFRSDALSRYNAAFDLAAMYTYLAAKAYDYETGLLPTETSTAPGSKFLNSVVRARTIGRITDGVPQVGGSIGEPGLADILARMKANWSVLDGRLGFNNPSWQQTWFSLRTELLRIVPGEAGDANWRTALNGYKVNNLFEVPEFRRYCIPFAAQTGLEATEPALVIPFSTSVDFGFNFFGRVLAGGDHAFDSSDFATKIRSIGVWFNNYATNVAYPAGLANTPQAYLIPVGVDIMRSPSDLTGGTLRSWQVLDQAIPVPYEIGDTDINQTDWIPLYDSLPGPLAALRRYAALGAYDDTGTWSSSRINYSSRLIGRSVWNTQWYLIIPAGSMNGLRSLALDMFINGKSGDGNGIKDIKLLFETYSYSGN